MTSSSSFYNTANPTPATQPSLYQALVNATTALQNATFPPVGIATSTGTAWGTSYATLPVTLGGTGLTSLTAGYIPFGNGTGAFGSNSWFAFDNVNGRLGLGPSASTPSRMLHLTDAAPYVRIGQDASSAYLDIGRNGTDGYAEYNAAQASPYRGHRWLLGGSEVMRIDASGNVGIGTSSPNGAAGYGWLTINGSSAGGIMSLSAANTETFRIQSIASNYTAINNITAIPMLFYTGNTERMRIGTNGQVGINGVENASVQLNIGGTATSSGASSYAVNTSITIPAASTSLGSGFSTGISTAAAAFTCGTLTHFAANQGTFGAGSAVTSQYGFYVAPNLIGATNNYGYYSGIPSGTGRWNIYSAGTAANYFAGQIGIGVSPQNNVQLQMGGTVVSGSNTSYLAYFSPTIPSTSTTGSFSFISQPNTAAAAFTCANLTHFGAYQGTIGAGSSITSQYGFYVDAGLTGATNNYGFLSNIPSATGRWNIYAGGTAQNYFAGNVGIGITVPTSPLSVNGDISGSNHIIGTMAAASAGTFGFYNSNGPGVVCWGSATANAGALQFTTAGTERMRIDSVGKVGIGTTPSYPLHLLSGTFPQLVIQDNATNATIKYAMLGCGHYTNAQIPAATIWSTSNSTDNITYLGGGASQMNACTALYFFTAANNTTATGTQRMQIDNAGNVLVVSTGGLGYGTGSGGAVTQLTSRTTGVTLNKTNGSITLFSAAGVTTATTFTVTNSTVAASDVIRVVQRSGTNLYNILVTAVAAGSFNITFYTTGGTATDAPVFNFAVFKAVTA